jgi:hypothetical protein
VITDKGINIINEYAEENLRMAKDNLLCDPIIHGEFPTKEAVLKSEELQIASCEYAAKYHAAKDILVLFGIEDDRKKTRAG